VNNRCEYCLNPLPHTQQTCQSCGAHNPNFGVQEPTAAPVPQPVWGDEYAVYLKKRQAVLAAAWICLALGTMLLPVVALFWLAVALFSAASPLFFAQKSVTKTHRAFGIDEAAFRRFEQERSENFQQFGTATVTETFLLIKAPLNHVLLPLREIVWVYPRRNNICVYTSNAERFAWEAASFQQFSALLQQRVFNLRVGRTPENKRAWQQIKRQAKRKRR
jgi:hypothetical protein